MSLSTSPPHNGIPTPDGLGLGEWGAIGAAGVFLCLACYHGTMCVMKKTWIIWGMVVGAFCRILSSISYNSIDKMQSNA
jgi:hypothetical protein